MSESGFRLSPEITEELLLLLRNAHSVLDIGCGNAVLLKALCTDTNSMTLCGIDPSFSDYLPEVPQQIQLLPGSAEQIPFPDGSFDAAVMQCVFSLCQPEEATREVFRILKPGGRLILSDLFSDTAEVCIEENPLLGAVYLRDHLESFFLPDFKKVYFKDESRALTDMLIEAIMSDEEDACGSCIDLAILRRVKARYGIWVWEKSI